MGTWGVALYSDDDAADVRDTYRDLLGDGVEGPAATDGLVKRWGRLVDDEDAGAPFWLALADTQWKLGRLEPRVRDRALAIIDGGQDLRRWRDRPKDQKKREALLGRLKEQLLTPPPAPKRVPKRFRQSCDWAVGEVVAYRLTSGRIAVLRVIGHHEDRGGRYPVCELLEWNGEAGSLPSRADVDRAQVVRGRNFSQFMLGGTSAREMPGDRIVRLGLRSKPSQKPAQYLVMLWRIADQMLGEMLGSR